MVTEPTLISLGTEETLIQNHAAASLRDEFQRSHVLHISDMLDEPLTAIICELLKRTTFVEEVIPRIGARNGEAAPRLLGRLFRAVLRRPTLLAFLSEITGCGALVDVSGTVSEYSASNNGSLAWHDDREFENRRLAITINLSEQPFQGGEFELRKKGTQQLLTSHRYCHFGSALIFRVAPDLEHRVLPVTQGGPRRVFSGWFLAPP